MHFIIGFCLLVACFALFPRVATLFGSIVIAGTILIGGLALIISIFNTYH